VTAVSGQSRDRHRDNQPGDRQDRQRPPLRRPVLVSNGMWEVRIQLLLDLVNELEEAPGRE